MMGSLTILLSTVFLIGRSQCSENFTIVGRNKMIIVEEKFQFLVAEEKCRENESNLVEVWNEEEWKEVSEQNDTQCSYSAYDIKMSQCFMIYACNGYKNDQQG